MSACSLQAADGGAGGSGGFGGGGSGGNGGISFDFGFAQAGNNRPNYTVLNQSIVGNEESFGVGGAGGTSVNLFGGEGESGVDGQSGLTVSR